MKAKIEEIQVKKLVGFSIEMSLANNKTAQIWQHLMPRKKEIKNTVSSDLYAMQVYDQSVSFKNFTPNTQFIQWAAVEVSTFDDLLPDLEMFTLPGGLYAVFVHKGTVADFPKTMDAILSDWMPSSGYALDDRPHFQLMGDKYNNNDPASEEEVWIPIRKKG